MRMRQHYLPRVSPFGHPRINACKRLPGAFRSLLRPSSPASAKASTVCPSALDHILPANVLFSYSVVKEHLQRESSPPAYASEAGLSCRLFVENTGFEPVTSALQGRRSP